MLNVLRSENVAAAATQAVAIGASANTLRVAVIGADPVYLKFGDSDVTAAAGDFAVQPGATDYVAVQSSATHVAVFAGTESIVNLVFGNRV